MNASIIPSKSSVETRFLKTDKLGEGTYGIV